METETEFSSINANPVASNFRERFRLQVSDAQLWEEYLKFHGQPIEKKLVLEMEF